MIRSGKAPLFLTYRNIIGDQPGARYKYCTRVLTEHSGAGPPDIRNPGKQADYSRDGRGRERALRELGREEKLPETRTEFRLVRWATVPHREKAPNTKSYTVGRE